MISKTSRPIAALTGATGFLGVHMVRALDTAGFLVRVLARRAPSPPGWGDVQPQIVAGELSDTAALSRLVDGASVLVHAAGAIKGSRETLMAVNRDGTARLMELAMRAQTQVVLVSSLAARQPELSDYAASKAAAESAAASILEPWRLTVLRPPAIYGPGDRETLTVFRAAASSPVLPILAPDARVALIHVHDAADAVTAAAVRPPTGTWALSDARPEGYGWREILETAATALERKPLLVPIPGRLAPGLVRVGIAARLLSRDKAGELLHKDWAIRPETLLREGPPPRWSLAEGFAATADWYRKAGWLR